jgi:hypothetical protein
MGVWGGGGGGGEGETDRNILENLLVINVVLLSNNLHETCEKNVLQVNCYTWKQICYF